eukprot:scaffold28851_cov37-Prasinocladus_malaysianus.AAC.1
MPPGCRSFFLKPERQDATPPRSAQFPNIKTQKESKQRLLVTGQNVMNHNGREGTSHCLARARRCMSTEGDCTACARAAASTTWTAQPGLIG